MTVLGTKNDVRTVRSHCNLSVHPYSIPYKTASAGICAVFYGILYGCTDKLQRERTVQTVKDYVTAHDSSPYLVLLLFLASLAELIPEMWSRVFKYKWNLY